MQFVSDSELIFTVMVSGMPKRICFGERSGNGISSYITDNEAVARAIRKTRFYKQGRIFESNINTIKVKPSAETSGTGPAKKQKVSLVPEEQQSVTPLGKTNKETVTTTEGSDGEVKKFNSITFAKNYLAKEFGVDKKTLKTPEQVYAAAEANGVKIEF